jgi:hypothetical protein
MSENTPPTGASPGSMGEGPDRTTTGMLRREALLAADRTLPPSREKPPRSRRPVILGALVVLASVGLGGAWWWTRPAPPPPAVVEQPAPVAPTTPATVDGIPVKPAMGSGALVAPGPAPAVRLNKPPEQ